MEGLIGQQVGNYRLVRLLGQGSFAEVYLGEHIHLGTQAAIKVLHTRLAARDMEQFLTEARIVARLEHPHIVRILDFGVAGSTPFLAMAYAPQGSLRDHYPKGTQLPLTTVVTYVKQIADALQYAHDEKVVHRDIKPENVLLGRRNEIVVGDFGIALVVQSSRYQSTKDMSGTVAYMAPEQIEAHPRPASDQYSLGIIVYEWLSGERPFQGTFTEIALKHRMIPPPPLRDHVPDLPMAVEQTVMRALAKDPQQRFPRVLDFATALERASSATLPTYEIDRPSLKQAPEIAHLPAPGQPILTTEVISSPQNARTSEGSAWPSRPPEYTTSTPFISPSTSMGQNETSPTPASPGVNERPQSRRRSFSVRTLLLVGVTLLVIMSSGGFFFVTNSIKQTNIISAQQTQASRATMQARTRATQQAQVAATTLAEKNATATARAHLNPYSSQQGKLVLDDPLKDNSQGHGWEEGGSCQFSNNAYHVLMPTNTGGICRALSTQFPDLTYEVSFTFLKGQQGEGHLGTGASVDIVFRGTNSRNSFDGYYFSMLMNGAYYLHVCQGNNCAQILFPTNNACCAFANPFHQGLHVTNTLAITVQGNTFSAYINGQRVFGPVRDGNSTYTSGTIGLGATGGDTIDTDAAFTHVRVWTS